MEAPVRPLGTGIVVLGMHRSGTSAVTGAIDALGLPICTPEDRMTVWGWNATGNFESRSLSVFDEDLLHRLGGTWWALPDLPRGWARTRGMKAARDDAARLFAAAHPSGRWVWKDPRACVLMPFWDLVLGAGTPRIIVLRSPLESAASLQARNGMPRPLALAMAERSLRSSLRDSAGRPVLITRFDDLLEDGAGWCRRTAEFISRNGVALPDPLPIDAALSLLDSELRHHRDPPASESPPAGPASLWRLWSWALERSGAHEALSTKGLPRESPENPSLFRASLTGFSPTWPPDEDEGARQ